MENVQAYRPLSLKDWIVTLLITFIPVVNFVMYLVWAFGNETHPSKKTWAQATLIWLAISLLLGGIIMAVFGLAFVTAAVSEGI